MTTKGRVEYHFSVFGGLSIVVIEFKPVFGTSSERLNAIAQVIAECDGMYRTLQIRVEHSYNIPACDYANNQLDFPPSLIYGILCDGTSFEFFSFDGSATPPIVSRGVFRTTPSSKPHQRLTIADYDATSEATFIRSLRPICEVLFYFLLTAYIAGVDARSVRKGINDTVPFRP